MFRLFPVALFSGFFLVVSLFLSVPQVLADQENGFTLDELVRLALERNPQPAIARARLEAARHRASALRPLPNPNLLLVPGIFGNADARDEEIILSQTVDLFGQRKAEHKILEAQTEQAQAESTLVTRVLITEVKRASIQLFYAQEARSLKAAQAEIAQQFAQAAERRAEVGDIPQIQSERTRLELLRAEQELKRAETNRLDSLAALNQLLGQAPDTPIRVSLRTPSNNPKSGILPEQLDSKRSELLGLLTQNQKLALSQAVLKVKESEVHAIEKRRLPQMELQARRSAFFGRDGSYALRAVLSAPIFDFGAIKNDKRAAQAEVTAQEKEFEYLYEKTEREITRALTRLEEQRFIASQLRTEIVPRTLDLLRKTQIGFTQGASSYLEVLEAQRTMHIVQDDYLQALTSFHESELSLESTLGVPLPPDFWDSPEESLAAEGGK